MRALLLSAWLIASVCLPACESPGGVACTGDACSAPPPPTTNQDAIGTVGQPTANITQFCNAAASCDQWNAELCVAVLTASRAASPACTGQFDGLLTCVSGAGAYCIGEDVPPQCATQWANYDVCSCGDRRSSSCSSGGTTCTMRVQTECQPPLGASAACTREDGEPSWSCTCDGGATRGPTFTVTECCDADAQLEAACGLGTVTPEPAQP